MWNIFPWRKGQYGRRFIIFLEITMAIANDKLQVSCFTGASTNSKLVNGENMKGELEPELQQCIIKLLDDKCKQVSITAAVTLSTLGITESKVMSGFCIFWHLSYCNIMYTKQYWFIL